MAKIIQNSLGCDFIIDIQKPKNSKIKLLQITDMQFIDASQMRTPDRLRVDEISAWSPQNFDTQCGNQIRSLIAQSNPDLIFITGDMVYGSFDDNGSAFSWFCEFMDSFKIPWLPVFGNHDNETQMGVLWQCEMLESSRYCVFKKGNVTGNGNYTVGISLNGELKRIMYMIDSNGCLKPAGIYSDQFEFIKSSYKNIIAENQTEVGGFIAFHIPTIDFENAIIEKGYKTSDRNFFTIGVDTPAQDNDFGFCYAELSNVITEGDFLKLLNDCNIEAAFTGHYHKICTCVLYKKIKLVFGLKTGQYDFHVPGNLGGTLVTLENDDFEVQHLPCLTPYAPFPKNAPIFKNFFTE